METINKIELKDPDIYPDNEKLKSILKESYPYYESLLQLYNDNGLEPTWRYYNDGKAWLCKVQRKTKTISWTSAWDGYMQATIYIPGRLIDKLFSTSLEDKYKDRIKETKNVGKSQPCIF